MSLTTTSSVSGYGSVEQQPDTQQSTVSAFWQWRHVENGALFLAIASLASTVFCMTKIFRDNSVPTHNPVLALTVTPQASNAGSSESHLGYVVGMVGFLITTIFFCAITIIASEKKKLQAQEAAV